MQAIMIAIYNYVEKTERKHIKLFVTYLRIVGLYISPSIFQIFCTIVIML